jgi:hypothetical protein
LFMDPWEDTNASDRAPALLPREPMSNFAATFRNFHRSLTR